MCCTVLAIGSRIAYIFDEVFPKSISGVNALDQVSSLGIQQMRDCAFHHSQLICPGPRLWAHGQFTDSELRTIMRNCIGVQSSLFISDHSFQVLALAFISPFYFS